MLVNGFLTGYAPDGHSPGIEAWNLSQLTLTTENLTSGLMECYVALQKNAVAYFGLMVFLTG